MKRRQFLYRAPALGALTMLPVNAGGNRFSREYAESGPLRISDIQIWQFTGTHESVRGKNRQHQVQPLHIYPEHRPAPYKDDPNAERFSAQNRKTYLKILTEGGPEGIYGPIDAPAAVVIDRHMKRFLKGRDALAGEIMWDKLYRMNRHARTGHFMMAISAVDNALWDIRGRYYGAPVYRLLGGPRSQEIQAYGSCLGFSVEPEPAARKAAELKEEGFLHQKWFLAYGPGDGGAGMSKNVELVRALREAVGGEVDLMFDAFNGWNYQYALDWAKRVEKYRPRWIEEPFSSDKLEAFELLSKKTSIPVATGEHFYNRWEVHEFLSSKAITVVQSDPEWCGGVSELVKMCTLASVYDKQVVPHGHNIHAALHVVASQPENTCPLAENLINKMAHFLHFEKDPPKAVSGRIRLPERPGFGIEFDESRIRKKEQLKWI